MRWKNTYAAYPKQECMPVVFPILTWTAITPSYCESYCASKR